MNKSINFMMFYPMILNFLIILTLLMSFNKNMHPINLNLFLITLTFLISLKMNFMINSWMFFILFLIVIGGLMIIFLYITSLSNNELFTMSYKNIILNLLKILMMLTMFMLMNWYFFNWYNNFSITDINYPNNFFEMFTPLYNKNMIFLMNYLLYSMMCIMNICYKYKSPLRQMIY